MRSVGFEGSEAPAFVDATSLSNKNLGSEGSLGCTLGCTDSRPELVTNGIGSHDSESPSLLDRQVMALAKQCRMAVQRCLREEEWIDADEAFFEILRPHFGEQV